MNPNNARWSSKMMARAGHLILAMSVSLAGGLHADELDLSRVPLLVNAGVPPNILVTLDDSGSMGWGFMPDGANYAIDNRRRYDASFNRIYYSPSVVYNPPLREDGSSFPNASFTSAWWDGYHPDLGTSNLGTHYRVSGDHQGGCADYSCGWYTSGFPAGVANRGQQRAFYFTGTTLHIVDASERQNFANWFSYYRTRSLAARTAMSNAFARIDPSTRVAWQNFNSNHIGPSRQTNAIAEGSTWRTRFFDWLQTRRQSGNTPMWPAFHRAGNYFENSRASNATNPYYDTEFGRELSCRQSFHVLMTDGYGNVVTSGTGIPNYDSAGRAIHDGNTLSGPAARVFHSVNAGGTPAPNLSDMAFYYWARDLRPGLENNVPAYYGDRSSGLIDGATAEAEIYFNPANDPATWQRMVNFTVTFGAGGTLAYTPETLEAIRTGPTNWPAVSSSSATTIDDAWHAAVNSRGEFLSAEDPQELINALAGILDNVSQRQGVTGSSGSSAFQRSGTMVFESSYDSSDWSGDIVAKLLDEDGSPGTPAWTDGTAASQLNGRNEGSRTILTWRPSGPTPNAGSAIEFEWGTLSAAQRALLDRNPNTGGTDGQGEARLAFLRGDRSNEQSEGGPFRNRGSVMGAFLDSNLSHVAAPAHGYSGRTGFPEGGTEYAEFRETWRDRTPMLYIGGNAGMLHAINADTGHEEWAFVPNDVIRNLNRLTTPQFNFVPTVNGSPAIADAYVGGSWRTILVGTLGLGGQAVYAIDITDPEHPAPLWEFTDGHAPRLGYTYGQPRITRLSDGRWVALIAGGYNSESTTDQAVKGLPPLPAPTEDPATVGDGRAALFVLDVGTGALIHEFVLPVAADSLAQVTVGEYGVDFKADFAIGGDLNGNLWRFDLSEDDFGEITHVFEGSPSRPITSAPRVFPDPSTGKTLFVFGTGKYLEDDDRSTSAADPRQAVYGIRECREAGCPSSPLTEGDLVEQQFQSASDGHIHMNPSGVPFVPSDRHGWFIRLGNPAFLGGALVGERVVDLPLAVFSAGIVVIETYIPSAEACSPLGSRVLYILSAYSGGYALPGGVNDDGDTILPGSPVFVGQGANAVGRLDDSGQKPQFFIGSDGTLGGPGIPDLNFGVTPRRRGWREISVD